MVHLVELFAAVLASRLPSRLDVGIMSRGDELREWREQADPISTKLLLLLYCNNNNK